MSFTIAGRLNRGDPTLARTKFYTTEIRVNDVPVFVDGWRPDEVPQPLTGSEIGLEFGLQNLGFSGESNGFERISVIFRWLDETKTVVRETTVTREIVAFRDVAEDSTEDSGVRLSSKGEYTPSARLDRYSIMAASTLKVAVARSRKELIDDARQRLDVDEIVAVLRPPLQPWRLQNYANPNYAVLVGLRKPSGQIVFSFDETDADRLCREIYRRRSSFAGGVDSSVFRYAWPSPGDSAAATRQRYRACSAL
jgi:hypothetical protein